jgi:hypothetical protein
VGGNVSNLLSPRGEVGAQPVLPALRFGQRFDRLTDRDSPGFGKLISGGRLSASSFRYSSVRSKGLPPNLQQGASPIAPMMSALVGW